MQKKETLADFYTRYPSKVRPSESNSELAEMGHFNVCSRESCGKVVPYNRRDFYKISLIIGEGILYYADKAIEINRTALIFFNPNVPYSWEATSEKQAGYFCLFTEGFINVHRNDSLLESPLFQIGGSPVFFVSKEQEANLCQIYEKMLQEIDSGYIYKYELLRNYVHLIIHEALKLQPADTYFKYANASARIASLFIELLERQFPIDSPDQTLKLRAANDYAERLSVHVNHLNRAVKEITGKTTTEHITERVIKESKALLKHTGWSVSEIAYGLGFEYPAYFNTFFKKQTNLTPTSFRQ
ncbi:helix-turn-helix domain-containing protein [Chryseolinea lacunae]|uniref:AraC family transcriptional regulator n=1 Tax=Chryseolinea lacunae TaxID=2801331 RepID=A0ABS1KX27_9BACT|nr:helix-turn-helix transcriptional regulator [Chryseolinea lacunae]MBL0744016.1 AraC family transcriptional regulator [Chryseolinea lacunae]